jgi:ssDNA-binding Zn-finger/Zn-ribbon topoisomerase 1
MIDGVVEAPIFDTTNEKIIVRHLLAAALSLYFRKKPHMFHDTETFIYEDKMQDFKNYLAHKPSELNSYIDQYILSNEDLKHLRNFKWVSLIDAPSSRVNLFLSDLQDKVKDYEEAEKKAQFDRNYAQAGYYQNRLKMLKNENVITLLSRYAVIPKYGFPVDVVQLDASNRLNKEYLLQRDLSIAISEYAPDSEVIVDGQKVVSRYIKQPAAGSLEKYYYALCPDCLTAIVSDTELDLEQTCPHCHKKFVSTKRSFLVPSLGFVTDRKQIRATTIRPIKTYTGKIRYLGGGVDESEEVSYKDLITLQYIRNDKLSVINESGFYYCPKCGYTKKHARSTAPTFKEKNPHETFDGYPCKNQILERTSLGHIYPTDVIRIRLNISAGEDELITLVFALLEGISQELQIERTDVNGLVIGNAARGRELVLFDQVPGGAGYVKSLTDISVLEKVLKTSLEIVSRDCCDEETTCNSCLRNYYNQSFYKQMKRRYAKEILTQLLEG